jgi:hypothetical protein
MMLMSMFQFEKTTSELFCGSFRLLSASYLLGGILHFYYCLKEPLPKYSLPPSILAEVPTAGLVTVTSRTRLLQCNNNTNL